MEKFPFLHFSTQYMWRNAGMEVFRQTGIPALLCVEGNGGALLIERSKAASRTGRALVERQQGCLIERRQVA